MTDALTDDEHEAREALALARIGRPLRMNRLFERLGADECARLVAAVMEREERKGCLRPAPHPRGRNPKPDS